MAKNDTLAQVAEAIAAVEEALQDPNISDVLQRTLEKTSNQLQAIEDDIVFKAEQALMEALETDNKALEELNDDIDTLVDEMDHLTNTIQKVSNTVATVVSVISTAVTAGIL